MAPCSEAQSRLTSDELGPGFQARETQRYKQLIGCTRVVSDSGLDAIADRRLQGLSRIQETDVRKVFENMAETQERRLGMKMIEVSCSE